MIHDTLFDPIRKKEVPATPEEHVRQATIRFLLDVVKVPEHLIAVEFPLSSVDSKTADRVDVLDSETVDLPEAIGPVTPTIRGWLSCFWQRGQKNELRPPMNKRRIG